MTVVLGGVWLLLVVLLCRWLLVVVGCWWLSVVVGFGSWWRVFGDILDFFVSPTPNTGLGANEFLAVLFSFVAPNFTPTSHSKSSQHNSSSDPPRPSS